MSSRRKSARWPNPSCAVCGRRVLASESHVWRYTPNGIIVLHFDGCAYPRIER